MAEREGLMGRFASHPSGALKRVQIGWRRFVEPMLVFSRVRTLEFKNVNCPLKCSERSPD